jgi:hypothetical protein
MNHTLQKVLTKAWFGWMAWHRALIRCRLYEGESGSTLENFEVPTGDDWQEAGVSTMGEGKKIIASVAEQMGLHFAMQPPQGFVVQFIG